MQSILKRNSSVYKENFLNAGMLFCVLLPQNKRNKGNCRLFMLHSKNNQNKLCIQINDWFLIFLFSPSPVFSFIHVFPLWLQFCACLGFWVFKIQRRTAKMIQGLEDMLYMLYMLYNRLRKPGTSTCKKMSRGTLLLCWGKQREDGQEQF